MRFHRLDSALAITTLSLLSACSGGSGTGSGGDGDGDTPGDGDGDGSGGSDGSGGDDSGTGGDDSGTGGDDSGTGGDDSGTGGDDSGTGGMGLGGEGTGGDGTGGDDGTGGTASDLCESVTCGANQTCNPASGTCECDPGFAGENCDTCADGFEGATCDTCASGYFGPDCAACPACESGTCDDSMAGTGVCECDSGFAGNLCDTCDLGYVDDVASCDACAPGFEDTGSGSALCVDCLDGFFGQDCSGMCPACVNGACDEGVSGSGLCDCDDRFGGELCDACAEGYTGASCDTCSDGFQDFDLNGTCEPDCGGGVCDGLDVAHDLPTGVHDIVLRSGTTPLHVDADYDGGAWILIGRGREGWIWSEDGDASLDWGAVKDGLKTSSAFEPRFLATGLVQALIDNTPGDLDVQDVEIRLRRAAEPFGTEWQETHLWFVNRSDFSWLLDTDNNNYLVSGYFADSYLGLGAEFVDRRFRDIQVANSHVRVFTWAWANHNAQRGFSFGSTVSGVDNNNPNTFMWEYGNEQHAVPYTEVYVRVPGCDAEGEYCGDGAVSCDDSTGQAVCECAEGYTGSRCRDCDTGYQDNDNNGTCDVGCDFVTCSGLDEACFDDSGTAICAVPDGEDCLDILVTDPLKTSGSYLVYPPTSVRGSEAYCDMTTDGGGYTFLKLAADDLLEVKAPEAEAACGARGMQLFVPRTQAHLASAFSRAMDASFGPSASARYLRIMGVYPSFNGATCANMALNSSNASCGWVASDGGPFWVSDATNRGEPNGDNNVIQSMYYSFDGAGVVNGYNDTVAGYGSEYFMCDTGSFQGP